MKRHYIKNKNILAFIIVLIFSALFSVISVFAQGRPPSSVERRIETINRQGEEYERDTQRRDMDGKNKINPADKKRAEQITAEVKEDFERLQFVYNKIVIAMAGKQVLDYKFIADSTAELKKRASRLKTNLALPKIEEEIKNEKKEIELTEAEIKPSLVSLRSHIYNFVTNPLFETSGVIDVELSKKASNDLNQIIGFSESINKCADKLKKPDE